MTIGLKVLAPGLHTTVQDLGRVGYQHIGVPVSGALDGSSLRLANALVGNPQNTAVLEALISGPTLEVAVDTARLAVAGAGASLIIRGDPPRIVAAGQSVTLQHGAVVEIAVGRDTACCYLAVEGGIAVPLVLGSASTYVRAAIGGFQGRALRRDDILQLTIARAAERPELRISAPPVAAEQSIRVVLGPQHDYFAEDAVTSLLSAEFRISKDADRMGLRLDGPVLRHRHGWDIVSDAIATGSIQVPGSGQAIVLLADHQTTGGYPKIATVISADLPALGRRRPGDMLRFLSVSLETAEQLARDAEHELAKLISTLEPAPNGTDLDFGLLYDENLISGVTAGIE